MNRTQLKLEQRVKTVRGSKSLRKASSNDKIASKGLHQNIGLFESFVYQTGEDCFDLA